MVSDRDVSLHIGAFVEHRGGGLGLYIISQLIKLMNGEVWLESELGEGSTFFFSLPEA